MTLLPTSFRSRLALLFGGLALVIGLPTYLYITHVYERQLLADRGQALHDLGSAVAAAVAENLNERRREIDLLAQTPLLRRAPLDGEEVVASLDRLQKSYPQYSWIGVAEADGRVASATGGLLVGQSVAKRPWFQRGSQASFLGDLHEALLLARLLPQEPGMGPTRFIDFAAPVISDDGRLRGVLGSHAHWRWAGEVVQVMLPANAAQEQLEVFIVNADLQVLYPDAPGASDASGAGGAVREVPRTVTPLQPFTLERWGGETDYVTAMVPVRERTPQPTLDWRIVVRQPAAQALDDVRALRRVQLEFVLVSVLAGVVLAWWIATLMSRPLHRIAGLARRIEQGDESTVLDVPGGSAEVQGLVQALRGMAATLIGRKQALAEANQQLERKVAERTAELARANEELRQLARHDALTGLANRLAVNERLLHEFTRMKRTQAGYAVLLMDIDHFKRVNDTYGHPVGDEVLRHVAGLIRCAVRESDFVARFGGEEFIALLPVTGAEGATIVGEKIRKAVESAPIDPVGRVTLSLGLTLATAADASDGAAVQRADEQLYAAKQAGRNRVMGPAADAALSATL